MYTYIYDYTHAKTGTNRITFILLSTRNIGFLQGGLSTMSMCHFTLDFGTLMMLQERLPGEKSGKSVVFYQTPLGPPFMLMCFFVHFKAISGLLTLFQTTKNSLVFNYPRCPPCFGKRPDFFPDLFSLITFPQD